jgi:hypothetical protein
MPAALPSVAGQGGVTYRGHCSRAGGGGQAGARVAARPRSQDRHSAGQWAGAIQRSAALAGSVSALRTRFCGDNYYVWLYRDRETRTPTSWERYVVSKAAEQGDAITIEMATKFSEDADFFTHHRMTVDLANHVLAAETREAWKIGFEYLNEQGEWTVTGEGDNVQAFEEKFDVFEMLAGAHARETRAATVNGERTMLSRSARHKYTNSWFAPRGHALRGVAVYKDFESHSFELVASGRADARRELTFDVRV